VKDNCLRYAVAQYLKHGGYICMRRTRLGRWWPHFLWLPPVCRETGEPCRSLEAWSPDEPVVRLFPPAWFSGRVKRGDG
jgi:hypothetical protein